MLAGICLWNYRFCFGQYCVEEEKKILKKKKTIAAFWVPIAAFVGTASILDLCGALGCVLNAALCATYSRVSIENAAIGPASGVVKKRGSSLSKMQL